MAGKPSGTLATTITLMIGCRGCEGGGDEREIDQRAAVVVILRKYTYTHTFTDPQTHTYHEAGDKHSQWIAPPAHGDGVEEDAGGDGEKGDEAHEAKDLHL